MAKNKDWQREVEKVLHYPTYYYQSFRLLDGDLLTPKEQRQELRRLLAVANKRQKRLQQSKFAESYAARTRLPRMSELQTERDVSRALADVALFIRSRRSTVGGAAAYQAEVRETLQATFAGMAEVDFTDPDFNWEEFGRYMQDMKKSGKAKEGDNSNRAVLMYFIAKKVGLTMKGLKENYDQFLERQDQLIQLYYNNPFGRRNTSGAAMMARLDNLQR